MDNHDEELTLKNVDEQIERYLAPPQTLPSATAPSLPRVVRDLQSIYEEKRLEHIWTRINDTALATRADNALKLVEKQPAPQEKAALSDMQTQSMNIIQPRYRSTKQARLSFSNKKWYSLGIGLVAAITLITLFSWPILSYALRNTQKGNILPPTQTATQQAQPTTNALGMQEYNGQHFKIQYPAGWVITNTNTGNPAPYLQRVQFRPSTTSPVFINVDALPDTNYSATQLLQMDQDAKLGTLTSTNIVTYNGRTWTVGMIKLTGSTHAQSGTLEIAYSKQASSYRIEFGATPGMFNSYMQAFNAMFASFYGQKAAPQATATAIPTSTPTATPTVAPSPTPMPSPTITNVIGIKVYTSLYFTLQYPANWVITSVITEGSSYQQTVQFRPSATSSVYINVDVLYSSDLSSTLLLLLDPTVKLGSLLSTNTVTYNGLSWTVGVVNLLTSVQTRPGESEIAYSNQNMPYKVELSAPSDQFSSYTGVFNTILASFSPAS